jgi:uncharacterized membrane protein YqaE (UPF0057 family)
MCSPDMFLGLVAILFPPLAGMRHFPRCGERRLTIFAVWVKCGICSADSLINLCLCMLGYLPGLLHAWYIIAKFPENDYEYLNQDAESGRVRYIIVQSEGSNHRVPANQTSKPSNQGYGATATMEPPTHQQQNGAWDNGQEGSSTGGVPPSYEQAVKGDHKIQSHD